MAKRAQLAAYASRDGPTMDYGGASEWAQNPQRRAHSSSLKAVDICKEWAKYRPSKTFSVLTTL